MTQYAAFVVDKEEEEVWDRLGRENLGSSVVLVGGIDENVLRLVHSNLVLREVSVGSDKEGPDALLSEEVDRTVIVCDEVVIRRSDIGSEIERDVGVLR